MFARGEKVVCVKFFPPSRWALEADSLVVGNIYTVVRYYEPRNIFTRRRMKRVRIVEGKVFCHVTNKETGYPAEFFRKIVKDDQKCETWFEEMVKQKASKYAPEVVDA